MILSSRICLIKYLSVYPIEDALFDHIGQDFPIYQLLPYYHKIIGTVCEKRSSSIDFRSHRTFVTPLAIPLNYSSALDKAITFYFLHFLITKFPPIKVK